MGGVIWFWAKQGLLDSVNFVLLLLGVPKVITLTVDGTLKLYFRSLQAIGICTEAM